MNPAAIGRHPHGRQGRRREPRFMRGVRRLAVVLAVLAWIAAGLWSLRAGAEAALAGRIAAVASAVIGVGWLVLKQLCRRPPPWFQRWLDGQAHPPQRRGRRPVRTSELVSWVAAVASVALVMSLPDFDPDAGELAVALALAILLSVGAVRLVAWVLRGFVKPQ